MSGTRGIFQRSGVRNGPRNRARGFRPSRRPPHLSRIDAVGQGEHARLACGFRRPRRKHPPPPRSLKSESIVFLTCVRRGRRAPHAEGARVSPFSFSLNRQRCTSQTTVWVTPRRSRTSWGGAVEGAASGTVPDIAEVSPLPCRPACCRSLRRSGSGIWRSILRRP